MLRLIVSSHGCLAEEMVRSSYMIFGHQEGVTALSFNLNEDLNDIEEKYRTALSVVPEDDHVLFLCDLYGGSPFNGAKVFIRENPERCALIGGVNLAMLIESYVLRQSGRPMRDIVSELEETGRFGVRRYEVGDDIDYEC